MRIQPTAGGSRRKLFLVRTFNFWAGAYVLGKAPLRDALAPGEAGFSTLLVAQRRWQLNVKIAVSLPRAGAAREEEANRSKGCHPEDPDPERNEGEGRRTCFSHLIHRGPATTAWTEPVNKPSPYNPSDE